MSILRILPKYLLYQKPTPPPSVFQSGIEDRVDTGETRHTGSRQPKPKTIVEKKFPGQIAEDAKIDEILHNKALISNDLEENKKTMEKIFRVPQNKDAVFRSFSIGTTPPVKAMLVFIDGITDASIQTNAALQPLMLLSRLRPGKDINNRKSSQRDLLEQVKETLVPNNQISSIRDYGKIVDFILNGDSALFIDGYREAILLETKGWHFRSIDTPQVEEVIRGPQEAFTEQIKVNTSLVRKIIKRPALVTEFVQVGSGSPLGCAVMYMANLANPDLVQEVKRRLESIRSDFIQESGLTEQMIEDHPFYPAPQVLSTERPDRVAANLLEGKVAILVNGSPFALIVPCNFFSLMQAPEDAYVRWPFGSFARLIRYAGLFIALLLPAHYIAIVAFHQELIPTDLLLAMTGARENVPFPSIVEVLVMEGSFELIREAGVRIPGTVGTTLGIVGALILGQAAVSANIVSPILIIVVAVTALGSFAIPNYTFSLSIRILRFAYIILAAVFGLLGILAGFFIHVGMMVNLTSFGVPFMAPVAPVTSKNPDLFLRGPAWMQESRPDYLDPLQKKRQDNISRRWLQPSTQKREQARKGDQE